MANLYAPAVYKAAAFPAEVHEDELCVFAVLKMWNTLGTDGVGVNSARENVLTQTAGIFGTESEVYKKVAAYLSQLEDRVS